MKTYLVFLFLILVLSNGYSQESDSSTYKGPFIKGRYITGLSGSIRSAAVSDNVTSKNRKFIEGYQLGTNSGHFFFDRVVFGVSFKVSRDVQESLNRVESETLQIGPWVRYYTSKDSRGSVYPELSLQYVNFSDNSRTLDTIVEERRLRSSGLGVEVGVGFTYTVGEHIGFDIGLNYFGGFLKGKTTGTDIIGVQEENFFLGQLNFRFGFVALVDEFFF